MLFYSKVKAKLIYNNRRKLIFINNQIFDA